MLKLSYKKWRLFSTEWEGKRLYSFVLLFLYNVLIFFFADDEAPFRMFPKEDAKVFPLTNGSLFSSLLSLPVDTPTSTQHPYHGPSFANGQKQCSYSTNRCMCFSIKLRFNSRKISLIHDDLIFYNIILWLDAILIFYTPLNQ